MMQRSRRLTSHELRLRRDAGREILLSFWKVHILHHAAEHPVVGQWMMEELREHGYAVSPGTLYPVLKRMERRGWLRSHADPNGGRRARREYVLTTEGRRVLARVRRFLAELTREVRPTRRRQP
jgi:PadR family transcriptional regulator